MASVIVFAEPESSVVHYSSLDGHVRCFVLHGKTLFDEQQNIVESNWLESLVEFVKQNHLDVDNHGFHAFVIRLQQDGLLS